MFPKTLSNSTNDWRKKDIGYNQQSFILTPTNL